MAHETPEIDPLTRQDVERLGEVRDEPCISLFMPSFRAAQDTRQNPIRFRNLIREVGRQLEDARVDAGTRRELLAPLEALERDDSFWRHQDRGLAVFRSADLFETYRLHFAPEELAVAGRRFHLTPVLPATMNEPHFVVLALSQDDVQLYAADAMGLRTVELPADTPQKLTDVVGEDLEPQALQFHSDRAHPNHHQAGAPIYHGQGGGKGDETKREVRKFFTQLDDGVRAALGEEDYQLPVVLVGVEWLQPIYRHVTHLPNVLARGVHGHPESLGEERMHEDALALIRRAGGDSLSRDCERLASLIGTEQASDDLDEIVRAAADGRIEALVVAETAHRWGTFDPDTRQVEEREEQAPGLEDLIDLAATRAFQTGGRVHLVSGDDVPGGESPAAAILRY